MLLSRRAFLKWMGVSSIAATLPLSAIDSLIKQTGKLFTHAEFDPNLEHGCGIEYIDKPANYIELLTKHMKAIVPPQHRKRVQIQLDSNYGDGFGRTKCIAWQYSPMSSSGYLGLDGCWNWNPSTGVYVWRKA